MIEFTAGLIFGSLLTAAAFVSRLVYVVNRAKWRKSVEPPQVTDRFRQRTVSLHARPTVEEHSQPAPRRTQGTARVRPIRRVR